MKIYIVIHKDWECCCSQSTTIICAFSEENSAKVYCAIKNDDQDDAYYTYEEHELGMTIDLTEEQYRKFINPNVSKEDFKHTTQ